MRLFLRLTTVAAVLLVGSVASATPSRVVGLGDIGTYVEDDTNVLTYPSSIARWAHFAFIDIGGANGAAPSFSEVQASGGPNGGAFIRFGEFQVGVLTSDFAASEGAAFLSQAAAARVMTNFGGASTTSGGNAAILNELAGMTTLRRYDLILGYGTAKDFSAGLRLSFGGSDQTFTPTTASQITDNSKNPPAQIPWSQVDRRWVSQARVVGGVSVNLGSGTLLDASIDYTNFGFSYTKNGEATFSGSGGNAIGLATRLRVPVTRFWVLIPQLAYRGWFFGLDEKFTMPGFGAADPTRSIPLDEGREVLTHSANMHNLDIGTAAELKASKVATFWLAVGVALFSSNSTDTDKDQNSANVIDSTRMASLLQWSLPYVKFGVEVAPFEWMHARLGAEKYTVAMSSSATNTDNTNNAEVSKVPNTVSGGSATSLTGLLASGSDFNVFAGASFTLMPGFSLDMLLQNQLLLGNFSKGFAGRASLSYKF